MRNLLFPTFISLLLLLLLPSARAELSSQLESTVKWGRSRLVDRSLRGFWKLPESSNNFRINSKLTMINQQSDRKKRGSSMLNFLSGAEVTRQLQGFFEAAEPGGEATALYLKLYDGRYNDNSSVVLQIELKPQMQRGVQAEGKMILWSSSKPSFVTCVLVHSRQVVAQFSVSMTFEIATTLQDNQALDAISKIDIKFQSTSFSFHAFLSAAENEYTFFVRVVVSCSGLLGLGVACFKAKKSVYNLSEWMIVQVAAFVVATSVILLRQGLAKLDTDLKYVALCALGNVVLSLFFLRKYESVIVNQFGNQRKALSLALFLLAYFALAALFYRSLAFWIYECFLLLALQINYAYSVGGKGGISLTLVLTILFTRLPFVYYRFCMEILTREPNNPKMLIVFVGITTILLGFITLQRYFGSRFIIPNELIPDYFNYYRKIAKIDKKLDEACSICTISLKENPDTNDPQDQQDDQYATEPVETQKNKAQNQQIELHSNLQTENFIVLMITPCDHQFHPSCLQDWMDKRLNCPLCRNELPPSEQQRDDSYCC